MFRITIAVLFLFSLGGCGRDSGKSNNENRGPSNDANQNEALKVQIDYDTVNVDGFGVVQYSANLENVEFSCRLVINREERAWEPCPTGEYTFPVQRGLNYMVTVRGSKGDDSSEDTVIVQEGEFYVP